MARGSIRLAPVLARLHAAIPINAKSELASYYARAITGPFIFAARSFARFVSGHDSRQLVVSPFVPLSRIDAWNYEIGLSRIHSVYL